MLPLIEDITMDVAKLYGILQPGDDVILPPPGSCGSAKDRVENHGDDVYCLDWFLCFRREKK